MKAAEAARTARGASPAQLREAERGFKAMLRRRFSAVWIAENAADLMGQANVEYAEWVEKNGPARNPVGWLLNCANLRAINRLDEQTRRPNSTSLDNAVHVADEETPTPEQLVLDHDRQDRLRAALEVLPKKEQKLLALVYFGELSIREAGRKLGWQKSAADRHHRAAMDKMRALVGDRSLLSPASLAVATAEVAHGDRHRLRTALDAALRPGREAVALAAEAAGAVGRQLSDLGRRVGPFGDQAGAAASSGGGRIAGACGVAVVTLVCGIAASGIIPSGQGGSVAPAVPVKGGGARDHKPVSALPIAPTPTPVATEGNAAGPKAARRSATRTTKAKATATKSSRPKAATPQQTRNEFGIEPPTAESSSEGATVEAEEVPATSPESGSSSGSSSSSGGSTAAAREFGL